MALRCLAVALAAAGAAAAPRAGDAAGLRTQLTQLRSQLAQGAAASEAPPTAGTLLSTPSTASSVPSDTAVRAGFEHDLGLAAQLQESEATSARLADSLRKVTAQAESLSLRENDARRKVRDADTKAAEAETTVRAEEAEVTTLRAHQRWLGGVVSKMLAADKELNGRTSDLQRDAEKLHGENLQLSKQNSELAVATEADKRKAVEATKAAKELKDRLAEAKTEKEALSQFYTGKEREAKEKSEREARALEANLTLRSAESRLLRKNLAAADDTNDVLRAKLANATAHERTDEDADASLEVSVKHAQTDLHVMQSRVNKQVALNQALRHEKDTLEQHKKLAEEQTEASKAKAGKVRLQSCQTMKQRFADAMNRKSKMHSALDDAVKLGRRLARENRGLRQAMSQVKEQLAQLTQHDDDVSSTLHRQIQQLHLELQRREQGLAARRERDAGLTPDAAFSRAGAALVAHTASVVAAQPPAAEGAADEADAAVDTESDSEAAVAAVEAPLPVSTAMVAAEAPATEGAAASQTGEDASGATEGASDGVAEDAVTADGAADAADARKEDAGDEALLAANAEMDVPDQPAESADMQEAPAASEAAPNDAAADADDDSEP